MQGICGSHVLVVMWWLSSVSDSGHGGQVMCETMGRLHIYMWLALYFQIEQKIKIINC